MFRQGLKLCHILVYIIIIAFCFTWIFFLLVIAEREMLSLSSQFTQALSKHLFLRGPPFPHLPGRALPRAQLSS